MPSWAVLPAGLALFPFPSKNQEENPAGGVQVIVTAGKSFSEFCFPPLENRDHEPHPLEM